MSGELNNHVAARRRALGLSQVALAERVGVSRQALAAVESGRSTPSTALALALAKALDRPVEALFTLAPPAPSVHAPPGRRLILGRVGGAWVAHALSPEEPCAADAVSGPEGGLTWLADPDEAATRALVAGCAPALGALLGRLGPSARWLERPSGEALALLSGGRVHVAGLHLEARGDAGVHDRLLAAALPGEEVEVMGLVGWRAGLALAPGNPLGLRALSDLARPGLRVGLRPEGSGAARALEAALAEAGLALPCGGPRLRTHLEAGLAVLHGAVHAAPLIEPVAEALGLGFLPLRVERFELAWRRVAREHAAVQRLIDLLTSARASRELAGMGAYDTAALGRWRRVEAA